jgi:hypothetical protein
MGIILAAKVLNTNASTRSCFPEKAASQKTFALRDDPQPGYPKTTSLAMRLSRHSARIKAKVKPKSSGFQDTSGP